MFLYEDSFLYEEFVSLSEVIYIYLCMCNLYIRRHINVRRYIYRYVKIYTLIYVDVAACESRYDSSSCQSGCCLFNKEFYLNILVYKYRIPITLVEKKIDRSLQAHLINDCKIYFISDSIC